MSCINLRSNEFLSLVEKSGLNSMELELMIRKWQMMNSTNDFPSLNDIGVEKINNNISTIKEGVSELFDSNPELANDIYEALGFNKGIEAATLPFSPDNPEATVYGIGLNGDLIGEILVNNDGKISSSIGQAGVELYTEYRGKGYGVQSYLAVARELAKQNKTLKSESFGKDNINESANRVWKSLIKQGYAIDRGKYYEIVNLFTVQQKQQAQQLYSQYLDTIFPDSKVKDIVYHGTKNKFDRFDYNYLPKADAGFYFTKDKKYAEIFGTPMSVILNVTNPNHTSIPLSIETVERLLTVDYKNGMDAIIGKDAVLDIPKSDADVIVTVRDNQIHILGSKQDIEGFKEFVNENQQLNQENNTKEADMPISHEESLEDISEDLDFSSDSYTRAVEEIDADENSESLSTLFDEDGNIRDESTKQEEIPEPMREAFENFDLGQIPTDTDFSKLVDKYFSQVNDIKRQISILRSRGFKLRGTEKVSNNNKIAHLESKIEEIKEAVSKLNTIKNMADVIAYGNNAIKDAMDVLKDPEMTPQKLNYVRRIIEFWSSVGDFNPSGFGHPIFGKNNVSDSAKEEFNKIAIKASNLFRDNWDGNNAKGVMQLTTEYINSMVRRELGEGYSEHDIFSAIMDIGFMTKNFLSLHNTGNPLVTTIYKAMERANFIGLKNYEESKERLDKVFKDANSVLVSNSKNGNKYDVLLQEHNGKYTGNLVEVFSTDYRDARDIAFSEFKKTKDAAAWNKWIDDNEVDLDVRLLFPDSRILETFKNNMDKFNELRDKHIELLKNCLGERVFERYMNIIDSAIDEYNSSKLAYESRLRYANPNITNAELNFKISNWEKANSPMYALDRRYGAFNEDGTFGAKDVKTGNTTINQAKSVRGLMRIPRKVDLRGNKTKWYDPKFDKINSSKELSALHDEIMDILDESRYIMPDSNRSDIRFNSLPNIKKSIISQFMSDANIGMTKLADKFFNSIMVDASPDVVSGESDTKTNTQIKNLRYNSMITGKAELNSKLSVEKERFRQKNGRLPNSSEIVEIKHNIINKANENRSFDLHKMLELYMMNNSAYKQKNAVIDMIHLARNVFNTEIKEIATSNSGNTLSNRFTGKKQSTEGLANLKEVLDYQIETFMGHSKHKEEGVSKSKMYNKSDKSKLTELLQNIDKLEEDFVAGKISKEYYSKSLARLNAEMDSLGGHRAMSKIGDNILMWNQLKGMGFNFIAGGVNLLVGLTENSIRAADGRFFTGSQLFNAHMSAVSSMLSFGKTAESRKLMAIEKFFDATHESAQELFNTKNKFTDVAYIANKKTEFINVMSMVGAYLHNIPVKNDNGETSNLYEAFNEDGSIKDNWTLSDNMSNNDFLFDVKARLDDLISRSHGNYKDPLMAKKWVFGRMVMQFRTWMPSMIESRWSKEYHDHILQKDFKGRWRSYSIVKGSQKGDSIFGAMDNTLFSLKQLCKSMLFMKTSFDDRMNEVDAANMRANLVELKFLIGLIAFGLMLRGAFDDDDDKKKYTNFLLNMSNRMSADITMFANPLEFENMSKNVLPVMGLIDDAQKFGKAVYDNLQGNGIYKNTMYKGHNKALIRGAKMIPFAGQPLRIYTYTEKDLNNSN